MKRTTGKAEVTRREFMTWAGAIGAGLIGASKLSPLSPKEVRAAASLAGSGSVIVHKGGGATGAALQAAYIDPFEAATGIKVVTRPGGNTSRLMAGVEAGAPTHDVDSIDGAGMRILAKNGFLERIDYRWFDPADKAAFSPIQLHEYGVPGTFYSLVLAYDPRKFGADPPKTWADFWDSKRFPGLRTLATGSFGSDSGLFEQALLADGVQSNKLYPLDLDRAFRSLDRIRPAITKFWASGAEPVQLLIDSEVALASAWNGRVADLRAQGVKITNSWEQAILQHAYWVVPKGAKNIENAMKFVAFVSQARAQARWSELIAYAPANERAFEFIQPERAAILPTAPGVIEKQVVQDYGWWSAEAVPGKTNRQLATERWERWVTGSK